MFLTALNGTPGVRPTSGAPSHTSQLKLPATHQAPARAARHHLRTTLNGWGVHQAVIADAALIVSELVANAAQVTARAPVEVRLSLRGTAPELVIAVTDDALHLPPTPTEHVQPTAESGRGLAIVAALTDSCGYDVAADRKTVWATVAIPTRATTSRPIVEAPDRSPDRGRI